MGELGFRGKDDDGYAVWVGKRDREEVWGQVFTNAMVTNGDSDSSCGKRGYVEDYSCVIWEGC